MRKAITISISEQLHETMQKRMRETYCSSISEYVRHLVREDYRVEAASVRPPRRASDLLAEFADDEDTNLSNLL